MLRENVLELDFLYSGKATLRLCMNSMEKRGEWRGVSSSPLPFN